MIFFSLPNRSLVFSATVTTRRLLDGELVLACLRKIDSHFVLMYYTIQENADGCCW